MYLQAVTLNMLTRQCRHTVDSLVAPSTQANSAAPASGTLYDSTTVRRSIKNAGAIHIPVYVVLCSLASSALVQLRGILSGLWTLEQMNSNTSS